MQYPSSYGTFKDKLSQIINNEISKVPGHTSVMVKKYEKQVLTDVGNNNPIGKDDGIPKLTIKTSDGDNSIGKDTINRVNSLSSQSNGQGLSAAVISSGTGEGGSDGGSTQRLIKIVKPTGNTIEGVPQNQGGSNTVKSSADDTSTKITPVPLIRADSEGIYYANTQEDLQNHLNEGWKRSDDKSDTSSDKKAQVAIANNASTPETKADGTQNYSKGRLLVAATTNSGHIFTTYADISTLYKDDRANPQITAHPLNGQLNMLYSGFTCNVHKASNLKNNLPTSNGSAPTDGSKQVTVNNPTKDASLNKYFTVTTNADGSVSLPPPLMP